MIVSIGSAMPLPEFFIVCMACHFGPWVGKVACSVACSAAYLVGHSTPHILAEAVALHEIDSPGQPARRLGSDIAVAGHSPVPAPVPAPEPVLEPVLELELELVHELVVALLVVAPGVVRIGELVVAVACAVAVLVRVAVEARFVVGGVDAAMRIAVIAVAVDWEPLARALGPVFL